MSKPWINTWRNKWKAGLIFCAISLGLILCSAIGLGLYFFLHPEVFVNPSNIRWALSELEEAGYELDCDELKLDLRSLSFWQKGFSLESKKCEFNDLNAPLHVSASEVSIGLKFSLGWTGLKRVDVQEAALLKLNVRGGRRNTPPPDSPLIPEIDLPGVYKILGRSDFRKIRIEIESLEWTVGKDELYLVASLQNSSAQAPKEFLDLKARGSLNQQKGELKFSISSEIPYHSTDSSFKTKAQLSDTKSSTSAELDLVLTPKDTSMESLNYRLQANARQKKFRIDISGDGELESDELQGGLRLELINTESKSLLVSIPELKHKFEWSSNSLEGDISGVLEKAFSAEELKSLGSTNKKKLEASLQLKAELSGSEPELAGNLELHLEPIETSILKAHADLSLELGSTPLYKLKALEGLSGEANAEVQIFEIFKFKNYLDEYGIFIPAPLHVLRGPAKLAANADFSEASDELPLKLSFETDLSSERQKFRTEMNGLITLTPSPPYYVIHPEIDLQLKEITLLAPRLGFQPPPRLLPDNRISTETAQEIRSQKKTASISIDKRFPYSLSVQTQKPLQIITELAKAPVQIESDFRLTSEETNTGRINVRPVDLSIFRRDARLMGAKLSLDKPLDESLLQAKAEVYYADYKVLIELKGPIKSPALILESEPPLDKQDIVAVLLFGSPLKSLDSTDGESASNAEAAIADQGLTLASMYFLASTPVESVSYDPGTKEFQAKFRLPSGLSLTVGSDTEDINRVGIQKRLGHGFQIRTEIENSQTEEDPNLATFLEWFKRY